MLYLAGVCDVFESVAQGRPDLTKEEVLVLGRLRALVQREINVRRHGPLFMSRPENNESSMLVGFLIRAAKEVAQRGSEMDTPRRIAAMLAGAGSKDTKALVELRCELQSFMYEPAVAWAQEMYELCRLAFELSDAGFGTGERVITRIDDI